jgi:predicted aspartyl protease
MSTFRISLMLSHPEQRERSIPLDVLVDTGAAYVLLPAAVVTQLDIPTVEEQPAEPPDGDRLIYRIGEIRMTFDGRQCSTMLVAGPPGGPGLLSAFTLETFRVGADPVHA